jgi:hypothetical protein
MHSLRPFGPIALVLAFLALAVTAAPLPAAAAAKACTSDPYAYAGLMGWRTVGGVRATITAVSAPRVANGHVAGWVGVGGTTAGPNGEAQWIQVGLSGFNGGLSQLYYEITRPGKGPRYATVVEEVNPGDSYAVTIVEVPGRANWWRVEVSGRVVSPEVELPGSHGKWPPVVTSESWNGGTASCNGFSYRFSNIAAYRKGAWRLLGAATVLSDKGYRLEGRTTSSFVATSR